MRNLAQRIDRLESAGSGKGRLIVVRTGAGHSQEDVRKGLASCGIIQTPADEVVCFATIYLDRDGNELQADFAPEVTSVH